MPRIAATRNLWPVLPGTRPSSWLPLALLLLALSTMYVFGDDWGRFYRLRHSHSSDSALNMALAENLSPAHHFRTFQRLYPGPDGAPAYEPYSRFPIGSYALIKLASAPFGDNLSAKLYAARMLLLLLFAAAAALAYLSLRRIAASRPIALTATLLAFSSYYLLYFSDMVSQETMDLFAVMLVFHGITVYAQEKRFGQLLLKTALALFIGWHVYALLLPFIVIGLTGEIIRNWRSGPPGSAIIYRRVRHRLARLAGTLPRSRYLRLGIAALALGSALLSFNFANEYAALGGETPLRELPSVRSAINRTGQDAEFTPYSPRGLAWGNFIPRQFQRIGRMALPYGLTVAWDGLDAGRPARPFSLPYGTIGMAATGACLLGLLFVRRHRPLLAVLPLAGLCWGIGMRHYTFVHGYEAMFYLGIPLTLFTLILIGLRRWWRRLPGIAASAALAIFVLSAYQDGRTEAEASSSILRYEADLTSDFQEIRSLTHGKKVYVQFYEIDPFVRQLHRVIYYWLAGNVIRLGERPIADCSPQCLSYYDFVISGDRDLLPGLLTPSNRVAFLFDAGGVDTDSVTRRYRAEYDAVVSGGYGVPVARGGYDVFVTGNKLIYYKNGCGPDDTANKFLLHLFPANVNELSAYRQLYGFESLDFGFLERGAVFDGNCIAIAPLPGYEIARIRTGQYAPGRAPVWSSEFPGDSPQYLAEYEAVASGGYGAPAARGVFDVYRGETALVYINDRCAGADLEAQFLLHLYPENENDLPLLRRQYGFDNLDFSFAESSVMTEGRCVAVAPLPDYPISQIRTGQYVPGGGQLWTVEFPVAP